MKSESILATLRFLAKRLAIVELVILVLTGLVCWWIGWRTLAEYSTGLLWAGFGAMVFGAVSVFGGISLDSDFQHQYSKTVMPISPSGRVQQNVDDIAQGMSFTFWSGMAGLITIGLGALLKAFIYCPPLFR